MSTITPLEAFRIMLRDSHPENPALPGQIIETDWFLKAQLSPPFAGTTAARDVEAAFDAINRLYAHVRYGRIKLRGTLDGSAVADIDPADQAIGDLNIWNLTFDCTTTGQPRIFHNVRCIQDDVARSSKPETGKQLA
jgi:hypothetical protein